MDEGLGAIDGVDDPAQAGSSALAAVLLAQDGVLGVAGFDLGAQVLLGLAVGLGDGCSIRLGIHRHTIVEVRQGELPGLVGDVAGKCEQGFEGEGHQALRRIGRVVCSQALSDARYRARSKYSPFNDRLS